MVVNVLRQWNTFRSRIMSFCLKLVLSILVSLKWLLCVYQNFNRLSIVEINVSYFNFKITPNYIIHIFYCKKFFNVTSCSIYALWMMLKLNFCKVFTKLFNYILFWKLYVYVSDKNGLSEDYMFKKDFQ